MSPARLTLGLILSIGSAAAAASVSATCTVGGPDIVWTEQGAVRGVVEGDYSPDNDAYLEISAHTAAKRGRDRASCDSWDTVMSLWPHL